jgi:hypothetical protein
MSQYSRPNAEQTRPPVSEARICADCGQHVSTDDRYCAGCGVAFAGAPVRVDHSRALPGFEYHLVQGLGWAFGFILAGTIVTVVVWLLAAIAFRLATKA